MQLMEDKMYKIRNMSKRALHVNGRFQAVMPNELIEVETLPEADYLKTYWKVESQPEAIVITDKTEVETKVKRKNK